MVQKIALIAFMSTSLPLLSSQQGTSIRWTSTASELHKAAEKGDYTLCRSLLENKHSVDALDKRGNAPLHYAAAAGDYSICQLLLQWGAQKDMKNVSRQFPFDLIPEDEDLDDEEVGIVFTFENSNKFDLQQLLQPAQNSSKCEIDNRALHELTNRQKNHPPQKSNLSLVYQHDKLASETVVLLERMAEEYNDISL